MANIKMQTYPRGDDYLADDKLFPRPKGKVTADELSSAITKAFERSFKDKQGNTTVLAQTAEELVELCLRHLKERSDPILSPYFLSQCEVEEIFELDAVSHEMQRHRMRIGVFYQFLLIELMRLRFRNVSDGKREGDAEAEVGPSGVGKTTFLQSLFSQRRSDLVLLPRYTDRPRRNEEDEGFEHYFISHAGLLQKVFANDFIHIEKWGDYYSAIESHTIEEALNADHDGIVLTSVFGAARLRATYGYSVSCLYLWTGRRPSLLNPRCLEDESPEIQELKWRIQKKKVEEHFSEFETASLTDGAFLNKRMVDNFLDIAAVNGRLRAGEDIVVLENPHDKIHLVAEAFHKFQESLKTIKLPASKQRGGGCFVLMPFTDQLRPVYDDHLVKVCSELGISVTRSDQIFSTRPIMDDIREAVISARYVIADLTNDNPNVFYELGVCHAIGKNVILVTQKPDVPFDVRHIRHIRYEYTPRGMQAFEATLSETLRTLQFSAQ